jgi:SAM-dependent methyltransferase
MSDYVVQFGTAGRPPEPDGRLDAPSFHRNHAAIASVLARFLRGRTGDVLEVGSGTGQHVVEFAGVHPDIVWWPSDYNAAHLASIAAWRAEARLANLRPPLRIDLSEPGWGLAAGSGGPPGGLLAIICINVLHIAPWRVAEALFRGGRPRLADDGRLYVYGPFMRDGRHTAPSNAAFDASLRSGNAEWGVRDVADLTILAGEVGMRLVEISEMPANNLTLAFGPG